jgi:hypothetical protein
MKEMKAVENIEKNKKRLISKDELCRELSDDNSPYGGISYVGYTLRDYIEEIDNDGSIMKKIIDGRMYSNELNDMLHDSGIMPI